MLSKEIRGAYGIELSDIAGQRIEIYAQQGRGGVPSSYSSLRHHHRFGSDETSLLGEDTILALSRLMVKKTHKPVGPDVMLEAGVLGRLLEDMQTIHDNLKCS